MNLYEAFKENKDLYLFEFDGHKILFKPLNWSDYQNFANLLTKYPGLQTEVEEIVWDICVVEHNCPVGIQAMDAGLVTSIAQSILYLSGCSFIDNDSLLRANVEFSKARDSIHTLENEIILQICEAFPSYTPENVKELPWTIVLERLAQAEVLLKKTFEFKPKGEEVIEDNSKEVFQMLDKFSSENNDQELYRAQVEDADNIKDESNIKWNKRNVNGR